MSSTKSTHSIIFPVHLQQQWNLLDEKLALLNKKEEIINEKLSLLNRIESNSADLPNLIQLHNENAELSSRYSSLNKNENVNIQNRSLEFPSNGREPTVNRPINRNQNTSNCGMQAEKDFPYTRCGLESNSFETQLTQMLARQSVPQRLPTFSGNPEEWPVFISAYKQTRQIGLYSDTEMLLRLQESLTGKAKEAVQCQLSLPECIPTIMKTLEEFFGRPETIIYKQIEKIRNEPDVFEDKLETLVNLSFKVNNLVATLKAANHQAHLNNPTLVQEILAKLPVDLQLEWAEFRRTNIKRNLESELSQLASMLRTTASDAASVLPVSLAYYDQDQQDIHDTSWSDESSDTNESSDTDEPSETDKPYINTGCIICKDDCKSVDQCDKFIQTPVHEKWYKIKENKLCRICLRKHGKNCDKLKLCSMNGCSKLHHPLLHQ